MRRALRPVAAVVALLAAGTAGCGAGDGGEVAGVGVSLEVRHTEPLRAGAAVRWSLVLRNDTPRPLTLRFGSGQDGDVVLRQGGAERYRWSDGQAFTAVERALRVGAGESRTFAMEGTLDVPPGDYDAVATLATDQPVDPVEERVTVLA